MRILTANPGSTSCKFSIVEHTDDGEDVSAASVTQDHRPTGDTIVEWAAQAVELAVGCEAAVVRVVHGGPRLDRHVLVDAAALEAMKAASTFAPKHNPTSIALIEALRRDAPGLPVIAALDTAFHRTLPPAAATYAIPARWRDELGLRRLGFHGLSHAWVARQAPKLFAPDRVPAPFRLVSCHLGGGSSLAAILDGVSVDTTMGFTPLDGVPMTTRPGALDPGLITIAMRALHLTLDDVDRQLSNEAGLAAISGSTGDMRDLLASEAQGDDRATLAIAVFVHHVRAAIASMAAALEGVDAIAFTGGIGSGSPDVRNRILDGLGWLGVRRTGLREPSRGSIDRIVSTVESGPMVAVIECREDLEMAMAASALLTEARAATAGPRQGPRPRTLLDGTTLEVRPIGPDDSAGLDAFHERCSERTHYRRFFSSQRHLQPTMRERFVNVDHVDRDALVATLDDTIIGVARYDRQADPAVAEVAFVVEDAHQRKGIATLLLHELADIACTRGIREFRAITLAENVAMQHVFRKSGFPVVARRDMNDPSVIEFSFTIEARP